MLELHLLPALLAGLLVYELVHILAPRLRIWRMGHEWSKVAAVTVLTVIVVVLITLIIVGIIAVLRTDAGSISALFKQMAEIIDGSRRRAAGLAGREPSGQRRRAAADPGARGCASTPATCAGWARSSGARSRTS